MMKLGKCILTSVSKEVIFEIEDKAFAEGGFCKAKLDNESFRENNRLLINIVKENFEKVGETCESQTRKAVQMNYLARCFSLSFSKTVLKVREDFGKCFNYNPVYFGKINHKYVTVEEFVPGDFQTYINSCGSICLNDFDITEKAETFVHYTYEKPNNRLIVVENGPTQDAFLKSQGKFFFSFLCTLFLHIFGT